MPALMANPRDDLQVITRTEVNKFDSFPPDLEKPICNGLRHGEE